MAKSICSLASPTSCVSSSSSLSSSSSSSISSTSSRGSLSDKSLGLKTSSSIDRRKRLAANARERKRMHLLNKAYDELRRRLVDAENKSKYDVLVQAKEYIQALATICEKFDQQDPQQQQAAMLIVGPPPPPIQPPPTTAAPTVQNIKLQATPVDMTYNQIRQNPVHQRLHYNHHNHVVTLHQKTRSVELYQQHQQNISQQNVTFT